MYPQLQKNVSNERNIEVWTLIALIIGYYFPAHTKSNQCTKRKFSLFCCYRTPNARWGSDEAQLSPNGRSSGYLALGFY
jgi:hypothetical protein